MDRTTEATGVAVNPLYRELVDHLRDDLREGRYPPGARLPTEQELMRRHFVSRSTVRQALEELEQEKLVVRVPGKGTFATAPPIEPSLSWLSGFVEDMVELGLQASARVLGVGVVPASYEVARQLQLPPGHRVVRIRRQRLAAGQPLSYDVTFVSRPLGDRLAAENLAEEPIFSILEGKYGILLGEAACRLEAIVADAEVARVLDLRRGAPVFLIRRTVYDRMGRVLEYERLHYRGDRIRFVTRLKRRAAAPQEGLVS